MEEKTVSFLACRGCEGELQEERGSYRREGGLQEDRDAGHAGSCSELTSSSNSSGLWDDITAKADPAAARAQQEEAPFAATGCKEAQTGSKAAKRHYRR